MTRHAEASGEANEFGQVPMKCLTSHRGRASLVFLFFFFLPQEFFYMKEIVFFFIIR